jgi:tetratricopeptide (TPR) repeat protein
LFAGVSGITIHLAYTYLGIQVINNLPNAWDLMKNGDYELAYAIMTKEMEKDPGGYIRNIVNRAYCLLQLDRPDDALIDFQKAIDLHPNSSSCYIGFGISLWWMSRYPEAVDAWKKAQKATYADAAGGVEAPAFLLFAAMMISDFNLEKKALALLKMKWKTKRVEVWPGPIAGFLLDEIDENTFLGYGKVKNPILKERNLTKIHFWMGLSYYRQGNLQKYRKFLEKAVRGHIIEPEYYMAKYELNK